jgi:membrane-associated phospholipid phosphatase
MRILKTSLIFFLLAGIVGGLWAEDRNFPYRLTNKDYLILPLSFGLAVMGESMADGRAPITLEEIRGLDRKDVFFLDRTATYNMSFEWEERSDSYRDALVLAALFSLSVPPLLHARLSDTATVAVMFLETGFLMAGLTYMTKALVGRRRPYVYNTDFSAEQRHGMGAKDAVLCFFSGHTAAAFTAATFLSKVFSDIHGRSVWSTLLWGTTLSLAALTGYARVKAGQHYPTDVIAGAAVGFAVGYFIPRLHRKKKNDRISLLISPTRISLSLKL